MKVKNRIKRVADILEKLGVAGLAIWLFRGDDPPLGIFIVSLSLLAVSILLTREG